MNSALFWTVHFTFTVLYSKVRTFAGTSALTESVQKCTCFALHMGAMETDCSVPFSA